MHMTFCCKLRNFFGLVTLLLSAAASGQSEPSQDRFLPLTPGTYWRYEGTVTWYDADQDKAISAPVSWKMIVEQVAHTPELTAAVISGFPGDLNWSAGDVFPKPTLLVETAQHQVFLSALMSPNIHLPEEKSEADFFKKFMEEDNLLFQWPLHKGQKFCDAEMKQRSDNHYCWFIAAQSRRHLNSVKGIAARVSDVFLLQFVTNPDDEEIELAPGIGIVQYEYHHHGTVADTSLKLVEFHPGEAAAQERE
jgi:hypothetical protein